MDHGITVRELKTQACFLNLDEPAWLLEERVARTDVVEQRCEHHISEVAIHQVISHLESVPKLQAVGSLFAELPRSITRVVEYLDASVTTVGNTLCSVLVMSYFVSSISC
jgi:hypothetical protein